MSRGRLRSCYRRRPAAKSCSIVGLLLATAGCGLSHSDYASYAIAAGPSETGVSCQAAVAAFALDLQPIALNVCLGCHVTQPIAGKPLAHDPQVNRTQLLRYTGLTSDKLFAHLSLTDGKNHGGGNEATTLPRPLIDDWLGKEAACD